MFRALVVAVFASVVFSSANLGIHINPDTVDELDLGSYAGYWYQVVTNAYSTETFEKDGFCATALYTAQQDGTVAVHNFMTVGAPNGTASVIDGYAYGANAEEPGQFKVHFDSEDAAPFDAPYWVLALGPVNANKQYDWAIVSDNLSAFLFVLARDVETYNTQYKNEVDALVADLGFTGINAPIDMYHGSDCKYEL